MIVSSYTPGFLQVTQFCSLNIKSYILVGCVLGGNIIVQNEKEDQWEKREVKEGKM